MTVLIRFRERTGQVWLEADYDGLEPPVALFDDLRMIGWSPPVPVPPPASALDWDHPDPARGTRYTVRPFRVSGARVDGPRGSGRGGTWTTGERPAYLQTLAGVLRRHAADVVAHLPGDAPVPPAADSAALAPPPPPRTQLPPPPVPASGAVAPIGRRRVSAVLDRSVAGTVVAGLRARGHEPTLAATTRRTVVTFRGNRQESLVPAVRVEVVVDEPGVGEVRSVLAFDGDSQGVTVEPVEAPDAVTGEGTVPVFGDVVVTEAGSPAGPPVVRVVVEVLVPLAAASAARGRLEAGGLAVDAEHATLRLRGSYRGNDYVEEVPGRRLVVVTDDHHLDEVVDLVVATTGVKRDDHDRLVVRRPPVPETGQQTSRLGGTNLRLVS